jgi:hypothetical protein
MVLILLVSARETRVRLYPITTLSRTVVLGCDVPDIWKASHGITYDRDPDNTALKTTKIARLETASLYVQVMSLHLTLNSVGLMTGLLAEGPRNVCLVCNKRKRLSPCHSLPTDCRA